MENTTQLTVADLASIQQLIDAAAKRGAFHAGEMSGVGEIYNKLTAFLDAVAAQQKAQAEADASAEAAGTALPEVPQGEENA